MADPRQALLRLTVQDLRECACITENDDRKARRRAAAAHSPGLHSVEPLPTSEGVRLRPRNFWGGFPCEQAAKHLVTHFRQSDRVQTSVAPSDQSIQQRGRLRSVPRSNNFKRGQQGLFVWPKAHVYPLASSFATSEHAVRRPAKSTWDSAPAARAPRRGRRHG